MRNVTKDTASTHIILTYTSLFTTTVENIEKSTQAKEKKLN